MKFKIAHLDYKKFFKNFLNRKVKTVNVINLNKLFGELT